MALYEFKPLNEVFFAIQTSQDVGQNKIDAQVIYENTRFNDHNKPFSFLQDQIKGGFHSVGDHQNDQKLPDKLQKIVEQYPLLPMPSPKPSALESPIMTFGEIIDTPRRIDNERYRIPDTPQRDLVANKLS